MFIVGGRCSEVVPAAVLAHHRLSDPVHGAQVELEVIAPPDDLVAEVTRELPTQHNHLRFLCVKVQVIKPVERQGAAGLGKGGGVAGL